MQMIPSCRALCYGCLDTFNIKIRLQMAEKFLVPFLAIREVVAPLANDPIMSGTLIRSFRHLKHKNLSTGDDFIHSIGIICLVPFLATRESVAPLTNDPIMSERSIRSFGHLQCQNPSIISDSIGRARMVQQFRRSRRRSCQRRRRIGRGVQLS